VPVRAADGGQAQARRAGQYHAEPGDEEGGTMRKPTRKATGLGVRIREAREAVGLSQRQLAKLAGLLMWP